MEKININRKSKEQKGITLVALVITIIILLILTGITLYSSKGEIKDTKEDIALTELRMVQNAILQRKTKIDITNSSTQYPGENIVDANINIDEIIAEINTNKASTEAEIERKDTNDENYYLLNNANKGLEVLGITNAVDEYIVNYETGEVINYTMGVTGSGIPLYIYAIETN